MTTLKRYYDANGKADKSLDLSALARDIHAMYTHWVAGNAHRRDFSVAMEHAASLVYLDSLVRGPGHSACEDMPAASAPLARQPEVPAASSPERFFDEDCVLNRNIDTSNHHSVLLAHFHVWVQSACAPRDFLQAVAALSDAVVYDHEIAMALGGLGGGRTGAQFLATAYDGHFSQ